MFLAAPLPTAVAQEPVKESVTLDVREVRLEQLLEAISRDTGYKFQYAKDDLDDVTKRFTAKGTTDVEELLTGILKRRRYPLKSRNSEYVSPVRGATGRPSGAST